jgi:trans-aconitate methyltransferase
LPQTWDPAAYGKDGAFVHELAGGVLEWLAPQPGERVLDLGCGDGQLTKRITAAGAIVTAIDASPEMVAAARARGIAADEGSAESLPYPDRSFDAVFSNAVLHWVRGHDEMMTQVRRVLRPGGRFVAEMGGHGNIAAIRVAFAAVLTRHGFPEFGDRGNYYPTPEGYARRLQKHGFAVERMLLFPRPTLLGEGGMAGWLRTFCRGALNALPEQLRETVVDETAAQLAPALRDEDGHWTADYVRLRFIATA